MRKKTRTPHLGCTLENLSKRRSVTHPHLGKSHRLPSEPPPPAGPFGGRASSGTWAFSEGQAASSGCGRSGGAGASAGVVAAGRRLGFDPKTSQGPRKLPRPSRGALAVHEATGRRPGASGATRKHHPIGLCMKFASGGLLSSILTPPHNGNYHLGCAPLTLARGGGERGTRAYFSSHL